MKNILVTGGAGFVGTNLCESLLNDGHKVYALDNFYAGTRKNVENLQQNGNFHLIEHLD